MNDIYLAEMKQIWTRWMSELNKEQIDSVNKSLRSFNTDAMRFNNLVAMVEFSNVTFVNAIFSGHIDLMCTFIKEMASIISVLTIIEAKAMGIHTPILDFSDKYMAINRKYHYQYTKNESFSKDGKICNASQPKHYKKLVTLAEVTGKSDQPTGAPSML